MSNILAALLIVIILPTILLLSQEDIKNIFKGLGMIVAFSYEEFKDWLFNRCD